MSTVIGFLKAECGKQSGFGSVATMDVELPFQGSYMDDQEEHSAEYDAGVWTQVEIVQKISDFATFTLNGVCFFETLPIFLNAGFSGLTPGGVGPYDYDYALNPATLGTPLPYTFYFGGGEDIGGTGPAIRIQDAYLESLTLSSNINSKIVELQSSWFGRGVNDNSGAGYAFTSPGLPPNLSMLRGLNNLLSVKDAGTTGGSFATMTDFSGALLDWTLTINTGLRPKWVGDNNTGTSYAGILQDKPTVEFAPMIRTTAANVALVQAKATDRTYQELQLANVGLSSRLCNWQLTGRWLPNFNTHDRNNDEVVMSPTFVARTPHTQTTTPHMFGWELDTQWEHT